MQQRILRTPEAARYLGLAVSTMEKMRLRGDGPPFIRLSKRAVGYSSTDLDTYATARRRSSTSEVDAAAPQNPEAR
jgi:predicted DNA-binding transcriptional regulator AlpA